MKYGPSHTRMTTKHKDRSASPRGERERGHEWAKNKKQSALYRHSMPLLSARVEFVEIDFGIHKAHKWPLLNSKSHIKNSEFEHRIKKTI